MNKKIPTELNSLADVFTALLGGTPENNSEAKKMLQDTKLDTIIGANELSDIVDNKAYFTPIATRAVYGILPIKLKTKSGNELLTFKKFFRLNNNVAQTYATQLNPSFSALAELLKCYSKEKSELEKKARYAAHQRQYRKEHPELMAEQSKAKRLREKEKNPEIRKAYAEKYNKSEKRKKVLKTYYEKHKLDIAIKARNSDKPAIYKKRYKAKQRFKRLTSPTIFSLLRGIIASKNSNNN